MTLDVAPAGDTMLGRRVPDRLREEPRPIRGPELARLLMERCAAVGSRVDLVGGRLVFGDGDVRNVELGTPH